MKNPLEDYIQKPNGNNGLAKGYGERDQFFTGSNGENGSNGGGRYNEDGGSLHLNGNGNGYNPYKQRENDYYEQNNNNGAEYNNYQAFEVNSGPRNGNSNGGQGYNTNPQTRNGFNPLISRPPGGFSNNKSPLHFNFKQ